MLKWMVWTTPVAVFFGCIALMLVGMTVWEMKSPTTMRKGWLPIQTTRGDRLFIGLAGKFAEWFGMAAEPSIWVSFVASMVVLALVMRKG